MLGAAPMAGVVGARFAAEAGRSRPRPSRG